MTAGRRTSTPGQRRGRSAAPTDYDGPSPAAFMRFPTMPFMRPSRRWPRQSGYAARRRSARSAACDSCAKMRLSAIVAGSIITRFCSQFRNVATGFLAYRQILAETCRGACGYITGR